MSLPAPPNKGGAQVDNALRAALELLEPHENGRDQYFRTTSARKVVRIFLSSGEGLRMAARASASAQPPPVTGIVQPICCDGHWHVLLVSLEEKCIYYFEAVGGSFSFGNRQALLELLGRHHYELKPLRLLLQTDFVSCGVWIYHVAQLFISYLDGASLLEPSSSFKTYAAHELQQQGVRGVPTDLANKAVVQRDNEAFIHRQRAELAAALRVAAREGDLPFTEVVPI